MIHVDPPPRRPHPWALVGVLALVVGNGVYQMVRGDLDDLLIRQSEFVLMTREGRAAVLDDHVSAYHARRFLVPVTLHFILSRFQTEIDSPDAIVALQTFALLSAVAVILLWFAMSRREELSTAGFVLGSCLLVANIYISKAMYWNAAEPYTFKLFLSLAAIDAYLRRAFVGQVIIATISLFVFDVLFLYQSFMLLFPRSDGAPSKPDARERWVPWILMMGYVALAIFLRQVLGFVNDFPPTDYGPAAVVPWSITINALLLFVLSMAAMAGSGVFHWSNLRRGLSIKGLLGVVFCVGFSGLVLPQVRREAFFPSDFWLPEWLQFLQPGPLTYVFLLCGRQTLIVRSSTVPLVMLCAAAVGWGILFLLATCVWRRMATLAMSYGLGMTLSFLSGIVLLLNTESRHQVIQAAMLAFLAAVAIDRGGLSAARQMGLAALALLSTCAWVQLGHGDDAVRRSSWEELLQTWGFGPALDWPRNIRGLPIFLALFAALALLTRGMRSRAGLDRKVPYLARDTVLFGALALGASLSMERLMTPARQWAWQRYLYETPVMGTLFKLLALTNTDWHIFPPGPDYASKLPGSAPGKTTLYFNLAARSRGTNVIHSPVLFLDRDFSYLVRFKARGRNKVTAVIHPHQVNPPFWAISSTIEVPLQSQWTLHELIFSPFASGKASIHIDTGSGNAEFEIEDFDILMVDRVRDWSCLSTSAGAPRIARMDRGRITRIEFTKPDETRSMWDVQCNSPLSATDRGRYRLSLSMRSDLPRSVGVQITMNHPPWSVLGLDEVVEIGPDPRRFRFEFECDDDEQPRINLLLGGSLVPVEIGESQWERLPAPPTLPGP